MKIPTWVPEVSRPFDRDASSVWEALTPNERRASFLFDASLVAIVLFLAWYFS